MLPDIDTLCSFGDADSAGLLDRVLPPSKARRAPSVTHQGRPFLWVKSHQAAGQTYHYFRRPGFPTVRLPGEPGSPKFVAIYEAALNATTPAAFRKLRIKAGMRPQANRRHRWRNGNAIIAWAEGRDLLTPEQANLLSEALGIPVENVLRVSNEPLIHPLPQRNEHLHRHPARRTHQRSQRHALNPITDEPRIDQADGKQGKHA
jgi:hypothetical protein